MAQMSHPYSPKVTEVPDDLVPQFLAQGYTEVETKSEPAEKPAPKKTTTRRSTAK